MNIKYFAMTALTAAALATPVWAEDAAAKAPGNPKIIVIDVQKIMTQSDAAKSVRSQVEGLRKGVQDDVSKQESALKSDQDNLIKQQGKLSQDEFNKQRQAFEQKVASTRKSVDGKVASLDRGVNKASGQIEQELQKLLFDMAKDKGAGLVLPKQAILVAETSMDFTDEALAELNKRLPRVDVKLEAAPAAADKSAPKADSKKK